MSIFQKSPLKETHALADSLSPIAAKYGLVCRARAWTSAGGTTEDFVDLKKPHKHSIFGMKFYTFKGKITITLGFGSFGRYIPRVFIDWEKEEGLEECIREVMAFLRVTPKKEPEPFIGNRLFFGCYTNEKSRNADR